VARLIARQLIKNPANLKNATREIDRSSKTVREEAKMERKTPGVTGKRLDGFGCGCCVGIAL